MDYFELLSQGTNQRIKVFYQTNKLYKIDFFSQDNNNHLLKYKNIGEVRLSSKFQDGNYNISFYNNDITISLSENLYNESSLRDFFEHLFSKQILKKEIIDLINNRYIGIKFYLPNDNDKSLFINMASLYNIELYEDNFIY